MHSTFHSRAYVPLRPQTFCQLIIGGSDVAIVQPLSQCAIPSDIDGPVMVWVTANDEPLKNSVQDRQSQPVVAGPQIIFVDSVTETLGQLVRSSS